ncbi:Rpn family recombination-promoting nuclease/putative transposase [Brevibacillus agri]|nr:Rpn family recombination-promoting nuclease/putative transposase [Brevibacillus agri]
MRETERFHTTFHLYEDQEQFPLTDVMEIHFMEIPKLMDKWEQRAVNPQDNELERWLLLLEADDHEEIRKELEAIAMRDPVMKRAFDEWEDLSRDEKKWVEYESRRKAILDEMAVVREAEIRQQKAREEGLLEGKLLVAKEMLAEGESPERIAKLTKLPLEEIEKLKQQLH